MEEEKDDIIYDLNTPQASHVGSNVEGDAKVKPELPKDTETPEEDSETTEETPDPSEDTNDDQEDPHEAELKRMVEEMGAGTVLEIIRDNRNAAIRQIIKEVETSRDTVLPSGDSSGRSCSSIFDLAALAV